MSNPIELNHFPEKVSDGQAPKADSKARGESVQGLESRNADLKQQNHQEKEDRSLSLNEQLQKNGTAKVGVITRNFQQSMEITDGNRVVVKGRSKEEVVAATSSQDKQGSQTGKDQDYQNRFGQSPDLPIGQGQGSAEEIGKVIEYKVVKNSDKSFSLGMDFQEKPDTRTPGDKLQDFMKAAAKRATDPEGWKAWAQGEINKFSGIGAGLNEAKEETKAAVAAGWKALTDGTVVEFLAQPNAINAPVFKTVEKAFDAMSKDPEAVNKAFEALGKVVLKASEQYGNLPDYEKGKIIGKAMFGMVNPEGSTEGAEAALKVADHVATHVDKAVWEAIDQAVKSIKEMAPDVAENSKQMLYDYIKSKGLTASQLERGGDIPEGFFDNLAGKGGDWEALNELPSPDVVQQLHPKACASACGEMLTNGEVKQDLLNERLRQYWPEPLRQDHMPADLEWLAKELGPDWRGGYLKIADASSDKKLGWLLNRQQSFCAELHEGGPMAHAVIVDGINDAGNLCIRDPFHATKYEMTRQEFLTYWTDRAVFRIQNEAK